MQIESDLDFIKGLSEIDLNYIKCMQCGTCSAICELSPEQNPFPRKEMIWAGWGLKDLLVNDPDIWLCYQCGDCTAICPRSSRPGDVLSYVRKESVIHHSFPKFFGKWVNNPVFAPLLLGIPAALLTLALYFKDSIAGLLGIETALGDTIVYSYSSMFPHWLLNSFFLFFTFLVLLVITSGLVSHWNGFKKNSDTKGMKPSKGFFESIKLTIKDVFIHKDFMECKENNSRYWSHLGVFFGFLGLTVVTLWIITSGINPLITDKFVYPFSFFSPWKILANLGGIAVLIGSALMIYDRLKDKGHTGSYFDWVLLSTIFIVVITGFMTEVMHYIHLEPHRHIIYFVHLIFVFSLLIYLPYSKFAHVVYRTAAVVYAHRYGRKTNISSLNGGEEK